MLQFACEAWGLGALQALVWFGLVVFFSLSCTPPPLLSLPAPSPHRVLQGITDAALQQRVALFARGSEETRVDNDSSLQVPGMSLIDYALRAPPPAAPAAPCRPRCSLPPPLLLAAPAAPCRPCCSLPPLLLLAAPAAPCSPALCCSLPCRGVWMVWWMSSCGLFNSLFSAIHCNVCGWL